MIGKVEILDAAKRQSLQPHVVEKDVVLGWVLAGINQHEELRDKWVFKGGTCLKKCYFETYRFSEDLDFTLLDAAHLDDGFLRAAFEEIGAWVYEQSGIEMPAGEQSFDIHDNHAAIRAAKGNLATRGPCRRRRNQADGRV